MSFLRQLSRLFVNRDGRADRDGRSVADVLPAGTYVNAVEIADADGDGWVRIVPFGEFPFHHDGSHAVLPEHGAQMVANFDARPGGLLFDVDHDSMWGRTKAAAWSEAIEVRDDGVYCQVPDLTPYGEGEVGERQYRFYSPVYTLSSVNKRGEQAGARLLSVAFTNRPYFDEGEIDAAVNSTPNTPRPVDPQTLTLLGLSADATAEQIANAVQALDIKANAAPAPTAPTPAATEVTDDAPGTGDGDPKVNARVEALAAELVELRKAAAGETPEALVNAAVARGAIKPTEKALYLNAAKADFAATKATLDAVADGAALPGRLQVNQAARPAGTSGLAPDVAAYVNQQVGAGA